MESWVQSWRPRTNAFCDFSSPPVESTAPATKKWCQVIRSAAPVRQNHLSKPEDRMLQNATPLRKSAPSPPNSSDEDVSCTAPATENASLQILFKCPTPANACEARFAQVQNPLRLPRKTTSEPSKVVRTWCFLIHFDSETRFAPQRRALFRHLNFQKCSERGALCTFWLRNVLRATTAHFFDISTSKSAQVFCTFWLRCASRHNSVQFFISHLTRCCRTRRFSEPTFRPSGATKSLENTHWVATFLPFRAPASSFFWLFLYFDPCLFFSSPLWLFPPLLFISPYCRQFDF